MNMASTIPVTMIKSWFDMSDGNFSIIQNNLMLCYNFVGGVKGKIAIVLFNRITGSVCFEKVETQEKILRIGSLWSNPLTISDILCDCFSEFDSKQKYNSTKNNYVSYLKDLLNNGVFFRFGKNNFYSYTYEKNIFSWGYMCSGESYVYPQTVKKLIASEDDLMKLFWNSKKPDFSYVMTLDEFTSSFAVFVDEIVCRLPPQTKNKFRRFDKSKESARLYINETKRILLDTEDFEGYKESSTFEIRRLPITMQEKIKSEKDFDELIPEEEFSGYKPKIQKVAKSKLYVIQKRFSKFETLSKVDDESLKVSEKSDHLISFFERRIKELKGITGSCVIFKNVSKEYLACQELYDLVVNEKEEKENFIREWIQWYVRQLSEKEIDGNYIAVRGLVKTFDNFKSMRRREHEEIGEFSSLYNDIEENIKNSFDLADVCRKFGLTLTYNYLCVTQGQREANAQFEHLLESLKTTVPESRRTIIWEMQKATYCNRSNMCGLFDSENKVRLNFEKFFIEIHCTAEDFNLDVCSFPDVEEAAFWKRTKLYEY